VRFPIDAALSPAVAAGLREAGHDATHANLANVADHLERGSIVVFDETRLRIRPLPIGGVGSEEGCS